MSSGNYKRLPGRTPARNRQFAIRGSRSASPQLPQLPSQITPQDAPREVVQEAPQEAARAPTRPGWLETVVGNSASIHTSTSQIPGLPGPDRQSHAPRSESGELAGPSVPAPQARLPTSSLGYLEVIADAAALAERMPDRPSAGGPTTLEPSPHESESESSRSSNTSVDSFTYSIASSASSFSSNATAGTFTFSTQDSETPSRPSPPTPAAPKVLRIKSTCRQYTNVLASRWDGPRLNGLVVEILRRAVRNGHCLRVGDVVARIERFRRANSFRHPAQRQSVRSAMHKAKCLGFVEHILQSGRRSGPWRLTREGHKKGGICQPRKALASRKSAINRARMRFPERVLQRGGVVTRAMAKATAEATAIQNERWKKGIKEGRIAFTPKPKEEAKGAQEEEVEKEKEGDYIFEDDEEVEDGSSD